MADIPGAAAPIPDAPETTPDSSQGYCVRLCVLPDGGFAVAGPEPLTEGEDYGTTVENLGQALKAVLDIVKQNPVGSDEDAHFEAGFSGR